eukprot:4482114-Amphidinium_carterae.1
MRGIHLGILGNGGALGFRQSYVDAECVCFEAGLNLVYGSNTARFAAQFNKNSFGIAPAGQMQLQE